KTGAPGQRRGMLAAVAVIVVLGLAGVLWSQGLFSGTSADEAGGLGDEPTEQTSEGDSGITEQEDQQTAAGTTANKPRGLPSADEQLHPTTTGMYYLIYAAEAPHRAVTFERVALNNGSEALRLTMRNKEPELNNDQLFILIPTSDRDGYYFKPFFSSDRWTIMPASAGGGLDRLELMYAFPGAQQAFRILPLAENRVLFQSVEKEDQFLAAPNGVGQPYFLSDYTDPSTHFVFEAGTAISY
ncbi:MAG: hypothetical protein KDC54_13225, partial [Lewinella sp.]|nr:hypothetical protein [Lewinella sp.]